LGINPGSAQPTLVHLAIAYVLTLGLAGVSYRFIETPFLRLKRYVTPATVGMARAATMSSTQ
jgi:peptidoglycan/LPS O-acetylase OafA/YrhL